MNILEKLQQMEDKEKQNLINSIKIIATELQKIYEYREEELRSIKNAYESIEDFFSDEEEYPEEWEEVESPAIIEAAKAVEEMIKEADWLDHLDNFDPYSQDSNYIPWHFEE